MSISTTPSLTSTFQPTTSAQQSITAGFAERADYLLGITKQDNNFKMAAKLLVQTGATTTLALFGAVETTVRLAIAILAKVATFFVPKQYAENLDANRIRPLFANAKITAAATAVAFSKVVTNFMSQESRTNVQNAIQNGLDRAHESKAALYMACMHINGKSNHLEIDSDVATWYAAAQKNAIDQAREHLPGFSADFSRATSAVAAAAQATKDATDPSAVMDNAIDCRNACIDAQNAYAAVADAASTLGENETLAKAKAALDAANALDDEIEPLFQAAHAANQEGWASRAWRFITRNNNK